VQERGDQAAGQDLLGLPAARQAVGHRPRMGLPGQVAQPVGQRRGQVPAVRGLLGRVGRGHHSHLVRQREVAHGPFQYHPEQCRLLRGRGGGLLVEEQQAAPGLGQPPRPRRGANRTTSPTTMGSPAKSEGSLIEAMTVSQGRSMACAIARMADVLPVPSAPIGTLAGLGLPVRIVSGCLVQVIRPLAPEFGVHYVAADEREISAGKLTERLRGASGGPVRESQGAALVRRGRRGSAAQLAVVWDGLTT
jgi:hypothetical protein